MEPRNYSSKKINEDLENERKKCTFNTIELTYLLDGGKEKTKERRELEEFFLNDPQLKDSIPPEFLSYTEKYRETIRKSCIMFKKLKEWQERSNSGSSISLFQSVLGGFLGSAITKDGMPFVVHFVMFIPSLMGQGTMEQQAYWISKAWNCQIMCTYAQTELGHGTFIRGLETTATYDPKTEEFILNSPTLTSYKWWPGGLGQTANYAIVMAQLYTKDVCHGIHPFVVQLRDEETHMPMPGIKIGDIGSKLGMNSNNNGYLGFEYVRIPRENMLMKNSQVLKDGTYRKSVGEKLTYGTMIFVRVVLVRMVAAAYLAKAATIATRYSAVRRQSELKQGDREPQILDYLTQQYKIIPHIASSIAMIISAEWLWDKYNNVTEELEHGNMEGLPELHAMSCCLKAVSTGDSAVGIEECRRSCGGHGYMTSSNFPYTYGMVTAAETYEGENTVLYLQTARFLIKMYQQSNSSSFADNNFLKKFSFEKWKNTKENLIKAYDMVAVGLLKTANEKLNRFIKLGEAPEDAWNSTSVQLVECAEAYCRSFLVKTLINYVKEKEFSNELRIVLNQLSELYAVYWLLKRLGNFLMYSLLTKEDVKDLYAWQDSLLEALRPNAVGLVDSFDIHDDILGSTLGAYDGNVYERLFESANKSPLNQIPVDESFHKYLKPFLKSNL